VRSQMHKRRPDQVLASLAARNHGLITRTQALAAGVSRTGIARRLRSGEWIRVYPGVYRIAAVPVSWRQQVLAPCLRRPGRTWAFARTAGAFWELDGCGRDVIEVVSTQPIRSHDKVEYHVVTAMARRHVTVVNAIPVTTVHRTLTDLGSVVDANTVEMALESALRRNITTIDRLWRTIEEVGTRGRRGPAVLAAILGAHAGRPTESALETTFAQLVRRFGLPSPTRQVCISDESGLPARVDFFWEGHGVVVEVDGRSHHLRRDQWEADLRRRNGLTSQGLRVLHVTYERMSIDAAGAATEIRMALSRA
jgi:very-short-patch-repair endonuclease